MELYEAARIDGAGRWRLMWHITLPAIRGTIVIMLILKVGSILNTGYEQIFLMQNDLNYTASEVFDTYIYNKGIKLAQYSMATAAGVFTVSYTHLAQDMDKMSDYSPEIAALRNQIIRENSCLLYTSRCV